MVKRSVPLLAFAALLAACGQGGQPSGAARAMPQVSVVTIEPQKLTLSTQLPGRTSPLRIAEIRPQVNGLVLKRLFTEGSEVKAGQVLYQIDPAQYQAALETAQAGLARSEANLHSIKAKAAGLSLDGTAVASDAFFPFRDGLDVVVDAGATCVIHPGGSMRDDEVIAAADERGIAMVFTGTRHFRH